MPVPVQLFGSSGTTKAACPNKVDPEGFATDLRDTPSQAAHGTSSRKIDKFFTILLALRVHYILSKGLFWGEQNDWAPRAIGSGAQFAPG